MGVEGVVGRAVGKKRRRRREEREQDVGRKKRRDEVMGKGAMDDLLKDLEEKQVYYQLYVTI